VPRPASGIDRFDVVNDVDVENYLRGVVAGEMPPTFAPAAIRAQAVVARTYALYAMKMTSAGTGRYDLFADERSQVYTGLAGETPQSVDAVDQTAGEVVAYGPPGEERIFKAYYSSCCGGIGQSAADAFGDPPIPPLAAQRRGTLCAASPSFNWPPVVVNKLELASRFRRWGTTHNRPERSLASVQRVEVAAKNAIGRPVRFTVIDDAGRAYLMSGEDLRTAVNTGAPAWGRLPSSLFRIDDRGPAIAFVDGHGRGHGVGLCQWCAQAQALQGMDDRQIVLSAYPSAVILRAY
jgi:stage II sporulation protein D